MSPVIDGEISDQVWNQVEWSSDFIQFQPEENTQPSNQTKYKLLYDNNAVYIFVKSINNPNETSACGCGESVEITPISELEIK